MIYLLILQSILTLVEVYLCIKIVRDVHRIETQICPQSYVIGQPPEDPEDDEDDTL